MFSKSIKFLSALLILGVLAGCSTKEVVVDNKPKTTTKQVSKSDEPTKADEKVEQIATNVVESTDESVVEDEATNRDSYINTTISIIDGQKIVLKSIHFKFDDYHLTDEMVVIANENAVKIDKITSKNNNVKIKLEGNCDEWGTDEYNYALGLKRAKTVKQSLLKDGIDENKIVIVSYGESNPLCSEHTIDCWKRNRRVDYKLLP